MKKSLTLILLLSCSHSLFSRNLNTAKNFLKLAHLIQESKAAQEALRVPTHAQAVFVANLISPEIVEEFTEETISSFLHNARRAKEVTPRSFEDISLNDIKEVETATDN